MKHFTKEWYQLMQKNSLHLNLQESEQAAVFSEKFFQAVFDARLQELLKLDRDMEQVNFDDLYPEECPYAQTQKYFTLDENGNQLWETQVLSEEEYAQVKANYDAERERMCAAWKTHISDPKKIRQNCERNLQTKVSQLKQDLPTEILNEVADIRVLALGVTTSEIMKKITSFCEENEAIEKAIAKQYYEDYLQEYQTRAGREFVQELDFHDCKILSLEWCGNDLVIHLDNQSGFTAYSTIFLRDAEVLQCEGDLENSWWLYEEIYDADGGFELHVLLQGKETLLYFTVHVSELYFS